MMHNWQNTGKQKGKIRDSRLKIGTEKQIEPTLDDKICHLCPAGCKEEESSLHYLHCPVEHLKKDRVKKITEVIRGLKKIKTYEGITVMVRVILVGISNREDNEIAIAEVRKEGELSLERTLQGQAEIGWMEMCQGFCHRGWAIIQNRHLRLRGLESNKMNGKIWKKKFITMLGDYCLDCWKTRNEVLHGTDTDESAMINKKRLKEKVKYLYKMKEEIRGTTNYKIFEMPLFKRLRFGIQSITIWVEMAEEVFRLHRENAARNTLHTWLQP